MAGILSYAGTDLLVTLGTGVEMTDGVRSLPPVRGKNLLIPYQRGMRPTKKFYGERTVVLQGEVLASSAIAFDSFMDKLKALFPIETGEQKLERTWADASKRYLMAEVRNLLVPEQAIMAPAAARWSAELVASDPTWYGSALQSGRGGAGWTLNSGVVLNDGAHWVGPQAGALFGITLTRQVSNVLVPNDGNTWNRKAVFTLTGATLNPKITNLTNGQSVQVLGSTIAGQAVIIDCGLQRAQLLGLVPPGFIVLGAAQMDWLHLEAGDNILQIDLGVAAPSVAFQASFSPAYL